MYLHLENALHRFLDLSLGRLFGHLEDQSVLVFLDRQTFLGNDRTANDLVCGFHQATSAAFSCFVRRRGEAAAFLWSSPSAACRWRFEIVFFSESCSFSIAGWLKIARS